MRKSDWFEIDANIKIQNLGFVQSSNQHPARAGVSYWILVLMDKGTRTLYADGKELRVGAREFFLLPPYTTQKPLDIDEHAACYVHFYAQGKRITAPGAIDSSRLLLPVSGYLPPDIDCFSYLRYLCDHALSPYSSSEFLSEHVRAVLSIISLECQKHPYSTLKKSSLKAEAYLSFIKENACNTLRAEDYEKAFDTSYHQINLLFKRKFGCTVKQYHSHVRMEYAAQMLSLGNTLQEVAAACGFDDYYFFIRSFTKAFGISPASYRKQHGG